MCQLVAYMKFHDLHETNYNIVYRLLTFTLSPTQNPSPFLFCFSSASRAASCGGNNSSQNFFSIAACMQIKQSASNEITGNQTPGL